MTSYLGPKENDRLARIEGERLATHTHEDDD